MCGTEHEQDEDAKTNGRQGLVCGPKTRQRYLLDTRTQEVSRVLRLCVCTKTEWQNAHLKSKKGKEAGRLMMKQLAVRSSNTNEPPPAAPDTSLPMHLPGSSCMAALAVGPSLRGPATLVDQGSSQVPIICTGTSKWYEVTCRFAVRHLPFSIMSFKMDLARKARSPPSSL